MTTHTLVALGLPATGKTTYLAAFWHCAFAADVDDALSLVRMDGDSTYLNELRERWVRAEELDRTQISAQQFPRMVLRSQQEPEFSLTFPDLSGEAVREALRSRRLPPELATVIHSATGILLFVHAEKTQVAASIPRLEPDDLLNIEERAEVGTGSGAPPGPTLGDVLAGVSPQPALSSESVAASFDADDIPTDVSLVDLLQSLVARHGSPIARLGVVISAYDLVTDGRTPAAWLQDELPLLWQALSYGEFVQEWAVWGVSAQGGSLKESGKLLEADRPTSRIKVIRGDSSSNDITEPVKWALRT